jgi:hypothetical protein
MLWWGILKSDFHNQNEEANSFFMITILFPFSVVKAISIAGFALPSISGEKITFHKTILLAIIVFLFLVQQEFPLYF